MSQAKGQELAAFSELERRVKSLYASEQALQVEVKKLRQKVAEAESELAACRSGLEDEQGLRRRTRERLDGLLARLGELPALKEER